MFNNLKNEAFEKILNSPVAWSYQAHCLKTAADKISWLDSDGNEIDRNNAELHTLAPIHRMLIGLAIETLLKAIIISNGNCIYKNNKFEKDFANHNLCSLIDRVRNEYLTINKEEYDIAKSLSEYIKWRGKYPIPKAPEVYDLASHSNHEHRIEQGLYFKLFSHLESLGVFQKLKE